MRIFLTGATGYIGSSVFDALVRAGHDVTALVRDNEKAARVAAKGARPVVGTLADVGLFRAAAEAQDGYVYTAFDAASGRGATIEEGALAAILAAARRPRTAGPGSPARRFVIYTSGIWVLGRASEAVDETAPVNPIAHVAWRGPHEEMVLTAASERVRTVVVRPGIVYGGGEGIVGDLFKAATNGLVRVVGDGNNRWPLVYDRDLADLYGRLAAADAASGVYHANDEGDERVNDIVAAIAPYLAVRPDVRHVPIEEARAKMGSVRRCAGPRPDRAQPARPRARLGAHPALRVRQRRPPPRGVARGAQLTPRPCRRRSRWSTSLRSTRQVVRGGGRDPGTGRVTRFRAPLRPAAGRRCSWRRSPVPRARRASVLGARPPARRLSGDSRAPSGRRGRSRSASCRG